MKNSWIVLALLFLCANVFAQVNDGNTEVLLTWDPPVIRELEYYSIFRFLEVNSQDPLLWELLDTLTENEFTDTGWAQLDPDDYQYAVIAEYTNGITAEAALSNVVEKLPVGLDLELIPENLKLYNFPNPFNPSTTFSFDIPQSAISASLDIYNLKGQLIKTFNVISNANSVNWDGTDMKNKKVSSGIYLYRLSIDNNITCPKKCLMLK